MFAPSWMYSSPLMSVPTTGGVHRPRAQRRAASSVNILRFSVLGVAAEAVNVRQLEPSARKAGVSVVQFTYQFAYREFSDGNSYRCRVTCSAQMAVYLIEQLQVTESHAMERGETDLAAACSRGIRETYAALMGTRRPQPRGRAPNGALTGAGAGRGRR